MEVADRCLRQLEDREVGEPQHQRLKSPALRRLGVPGSKPVSAGCCFHHGPVRRRFAAQQGRQIDHALAAMTVSSALAPLSFT